MVSLSPTSLPASLPVNVEGSERVTGQVDPPIVSTWKNKCNKGLDKRLHGIMVHKRKETRWAWQLHQHRPRVCRDRSTAWWSCEELEVWGGKEAPILGSIQERRKLHRVKLDKTPLSLILKSSCPVLPSWAPPRRMWNYTSFHRVFSMLGNSFSGTDFLN